VKACAEYGREDLDAISKEIDGKTPEEVTILAVAIQCIVCFIIGL